jgi:transcriptional regulator with XRE-family HTH domain
MRKPPPLSAQVRRALKESGITSYAVSKATGIDQAVLSRFRAGSSVSMGTLDRLGTFLRLSIVREAKKEK